MSTFTRGLSGALACLLWCGCAAEGALEEEQLGVQSQELAFGIQGFARFDATGSAVPGSVATTIGTAVDAVRTSAGRYTVTFHSLAAFDPTAAGQAGTLQVVAVGAGNARCALAGNWTFTASHDVVGKVICRSPGVGVTDSGFYAYYGRGPASSGRSAYVRVNADATIPNAAKFSSSGAAISVGHPIAGVYWVFMSAESREELQVTAISTTAHCHASLRELGVTTVVCFNAAGERVDTRFTLNQAGRNGLALAGVGAFAQVNASGVLDNRYDYNACTFGATSSSRVGVGRYVVKHTLVGESLASYQLSAYDAGSGYCKIHKVTAPGAGTTATVTAQCYSNEGVAQDLGFVESYAVYLGDCGGCPDCQGGACVLGACQPVTVAAATAPRSVAANDATVWYGNEPGPVPSGGLLYSVPRAGGASTKLVTLSEATHFMATSLVLGPSNVYWYEPGGGVYKKPLVGGSRALFATGGIDTQPRALAMVGSDLYFADGFASQLYAISSAGIKTPLLPSPPPPGVTNYYPFNIAADASRVYFVRDTGGMVSSVPLTGGEPFELSKPALSTPGVGIAVSAITTDGVNVYWATSKAAGKIFQVPAAGGATTTFEMSTGLVTGLAIRDGKLFWTVKDPGTVRSKPLAGGATLTLASDENLPNSIFVDDTTVFWTNADAVRKVARSL
jgi:hypothetical protein